MSTAALHTESSMDAASSALAKELDLPTRGVQAVLNLIAQQATVPFIARYRKEVTGNLDEVQVRAIVEQHILWQDLEKRRKTVLSSIREQGKLNPKLEAQILACRSRSRLEDVYLPFRPKRKTRASTARAQGLAPLAKRILEQPASGSPTADARRFVSTLEQLPDVDAVLSGARDIIAEQVSERAAIRAFVRRTMQRFGQLISKRARGYDASNRNAFEQYYEHTESLARVPSHRYLAMSRGESEGVIKVTVHLEIDRLVIDVLPMTPYNPRSPYADELAKAVRDALARLVLPAIERELRKDTKQHADSDAVDVFGKNLRALLMAPPLGQKTIIAIDPGLRTGCKCVVLDPTGRLLEHTIVYVTSHTERAVMQLRSWVERYRPAAIAVGNGTGSREAMDVARRASDHSDTTITVEVNEAGASVYSASDIARAEFPDLDLTVRGAISIGRRLQDPLAELVKVEPKSIGVGQYQHDVDQLLLNRKLGHVVESCVNQVGVELNSASASLLSFVSGIGPKLAEKIVAHRDSRGPFSSRRQLLDVSGLGARAFEQCAGFLRIRDAAHPLDASAVHPERYAVVEQMAKRLGVSLHTLCGNRALIQSLTISEYVSHNLGEHTLRDILQELAKPGRDPRAAFEAPEWRDDIVAIEDLYEGLILDGKITNVTHFGAFVDIGVHQDGLIHISELSDQWVDDPHAVAQPGQSIRVRVLSVDGDRRRIALSAKL